MMFSITEVMTETINNEIVLALTLVCAGTNSQKPANSPHYHAAISGDDVMMRLLAMVMMMPLFHIS